MMHGTNHDGETANVKFDTHIIFYTMQPRTQCTQLLKRAPKQWVALQRLSKIAPGITETAQKALGAAQQVEASSTKGHLGQRADCDGYDHCTAVLKTTLARHCENPTDAKERGARQLLTS